MEYIGHNYTHQIAKGILEINHGFNDQEDEAQPQKAISIYYSIEQGRLLTSEEIDELLAM